MVQHWTVLANARVLDIGCGIGMYTRAFRQVSSAVYGIEIEHERAIEARNSVVGIAEAPGEKLPFPNDTFDVVFSHEVLEHVLDDRACTAEMVRVARVGGRIVIFVPNRLYPFETHGVYWRGQYHFGNKPLVNWLPARLRNKLAPHVRAYTSSGLQALFAGLPVRVITHTQIFPGYDNVVARRPALGRLLRNTTYLLERTPVRVVGLSHFLVLEKVPLS